MIVIIIIIECIIYYDLFDSKILSRRFGLVMAVVMVVVMVLNEAACKQAGKVSKYFSFHYYYIIARQYDEPREERRRGREGERKNELNSISTVKNSKAKN